MTFPRSGAARRNTPLFLAFLNTVEDDGKTRQIDTFRDAIGLLELLYPYALSRDHPTPTTAQLANLRGLRDVGYAVLSAMAAGRRPGREEGLYLEMAIKSAIRDSQFRFELHGLHMDPGPLGGVHDELVLSLADLLQSSEIERLKECKRCTHLFVDHGRGQGRRWCSMARCGNRAKAETFRQKQRGQQA